MHNEGASQACPFFFWVRQARPVIFLHFYVPLLVRTGQLGLATVSPDLLFPQILPPVCRSGPGMFQKQLPLFSHYSYIMTPTLRNRDCKLPGEVRNFG